MKKPLEETSAKTKRRHVQVVAEYHDISTAVMMATFLPGGGQLYNNQNIKGIAFVLLTFLGFFSVVWYPNRFTLYLAGTGEIIVWLVGIFDAAIIARRLRRGQKVSVWKWF